MIESIRHPGAVSDWLPRAEMCGTCHEIANPAAAQLTADGTDTGRRFPLDTTYSEWRNSVYGEPGGADAQTCQDCHMPRFGSPTTVSTNATAMTRDNPRQHHFAGANAWAIRMLGQMRNDESTGEFFAPDLAPFYEVAAQRAEAMLRDAVTLEIREAPTQAMPGETVSVLTRITNRSGHRVPTGYADGRRVWLEVAVVEAGGRETVVSGAYDAAEAHLGEDPQLKVYEIHPGRVGMGAISHIALQNTIVSDTRIPPRGYRPPAGHEPVGADYSGGENGALRHWDDARYTVTIPSTARGPVTLRVRARYQSTTREYVEHLAEANRTDDRGRELLRRYEASGRAAPFNMAEATAQITTPGGAVDDAGAQADASVTADAGGGLDAGTISPAESGGGCSCRAVSAPTSRRAGAGAALLAGLAAALAGRRRRRG
ncbi:MAG: MYXO-CTERM sorting domain-containing protein [Polyangiales bacterium]